MEEKDDTSQKLKSPAEDFNMGDASRKSRLDSIGEAPRKSRVDLSSLPTRQYLDQTVVPILMHGLSTLSKERPADPISWLASFLMKNKAHFESVSSAPSVSSQPSTSAMKHEASL